MSKGHEPKVKRAWNWLWPGWDRFGESMIKERKCAVTLALAFHWAASQNQMDVKAMLNGDWLGKTDFDNYDMALVASKRAYEKWFEAGMPLPPVNKKAGVANVQYADELPDDQNWFKEQVADELVMRAEFERRHNSPENLAARAKLCNKGHGWKCRRAANHLGQCIPERQEVKDEHGADS